MHYKHSFTQSAVDDPVGSEMYQELDSRGLKTGNCFCNALTLVEDLFILEKFHQVSV